MSGALCVRSPFLPNEFVVRINNFRCLWLCVNFNIEINRIREKKIILRKHFTYNSGFFVTFNGLKSIIYEFGCLCLDRSSIFLISVNKVILSMANIFFIY